MKVSTEIEIKSTDYGFATIYIACDPIQARQFLRGYCMKGACVSVSDCEYIYTFGAEIGVRVDIINYARFPVSQLEITNEAKILAKEMITNLHQGSCTVFSPDGSFFLSRRKSE